MFPKSFSMSSPTSPLRVKDMYQVGRFSFRITPARQSSKAVTEMKDRTRVTKKIVVPVSSAVSVSSACSVSSAASVSSDASVSSASFVSCVCTRYYLRSTPARLARSHDITELEASQDFLGLRGGGLVDKMKKWAKKAKAKVKVSSQTLHSSPRTHLLTISQRKLNRGQDDDDFFSGGLNFRYGETVGCPINCRFCLPH